MRHAAHKANKGSVERTSLMALFRSSKGSHTARVVRTVQLANGDAAALGVEPALAAKLNEVAPLTRRAIRESARAAQRRSAMLSSASLAALVGTAATAVAFANPDASSSRVLADDPATTTTQMERVQATVVSRSEERTSLTGSDSTVTSQTKASDAGSSSTGNEGTWQLNDSDSAIDVSQLSRSIADNPQVAALMDQDSGKLPEGFNPNHETGDVGLAYAFSQCTWWAYLRRHELGLPVGSYFGNGQDWANSARNLGYWVDNTPRHVGDVMVFRAGQAGASSVYGHVAIVEAINADGSITISECGSALNGHPGSRTFTAAETGDFEFIHY